MAIPSSDFPESAPSPIPPLEAGDQLGRDEFERRYWAMPGVKKAELIEGIVYMPSPVSGRHGRHHLWLGGWLTQYLGYTPGLDAADNATVRFDDVNEPQPDLLLAIKPSSGGRCRLDEEEYFTGPPDFIAEIAASRVSYDLHAKLRVYQAQGVREYLVWRTRDHEIDWFRLHEGKYEPLAPDAAGILKSTIFPGLWLNRDALLRGELPAVFGTLREGIDSAEHANFLAELQARRQ